MKNNYLEESFIKSLNNIQSINQFFERNDF